MTRPVTTVRTGGETKGLHLIEGATHIDIYERALFVTLSIAKLTEFFGRHLAAARESK